MCSLAHVPCHVNCWPYNPIEARPQLGLGKPNGGVILLLPLGPITSLNLIGGGSVPSITLH